jgi:hypothetical protein
VTSGFCLRDEGFNAKTIMLDFVQPLAAGWQLIGFCWEAWRNEPGREGTHTQHGAHSYSGASQSFDTMQAFAAATDAH